MQHYGSIIEQKDDHIRADTKSGQKHDDRIPEFHRTIGLQSFLTDQHRATDDFFGDEDGDSSRSKWTWDNSEGNTESLTVLTNASAISNDNNSESNQYHSNALLHCSRLWPKGETLRRVIGILLAVVFILIPILLHLHMDDDDTYTSNDSSSSAFQFSGSGTYDYIVVGGGPAGILVATQLARSMDASKIMLLEAGTISQSSVMENLYRRKMEDLAPTEGPSSLIMPSFSSSLPQLLNQMDIPLLWSGVASKASSGNKTTASDDLHHWHVPKTLLAKALGGCGVHNAMLYVRALRTDFEKWNMTGWSSDLLFRYYQDLESFVDYTKEDTPGRTEANSKTADPRSHSADTATFQRGTSGPIRTHPAGPNLDTVGELFRQSSAGTIGLAASQGFNHPDPSARIGAGRYEFNIRNGVRDSVARAILGDDISQEDSNNDRSSSNSGIPENLDIVLGASVTRVLIKEPKKKRSETGLLPQAVGVEFMNEDGQLHQILLKDSSSSEVILSCGAIMTPQVLSNSGIGENGSVANLPGVGKNLQDHPVVPVFFRLAPNMTKDDGSNYLLGQQWQTYLDAVQRLRSDGVSNIDQKTRNELLQQMGTMGTAGFSTGAFLRSPWAKNEAPDLQLTVFPRSVEPHVVDKEPQSEYSHSMTSSTMLVTIALLDADARYELQLDRSNTRINQSQQELNYMPSSSLGIPSISLPQDSQEYLSDMDVRRLSWGIEQVRSVQQAPPLVHSTREEVFPGAGADLEKYIRSRQLPNSHWTGTTKMGHSDDPMAVVDESLKVRNIKGLRVVDAGVMPTIPNGNTHSAVTVVASRAVDLIRTEILAAM